MRRALSRSSPVVQAGAGLAAAVALAAGAVALWIGPTRAGIASQRRTLASVRLAQTSADGVERRILYLQQRTHSLQARLATLRAAAPGDIDGPGLLDILQILAAESGLSITAFKRAPSSAPEWLTASSVALEFEGTYASLVQFLRLADDHAAMLAVTALRLRAHDRPSPHLTLAGSARVTLFVPAALSEDGQALQRPPAGPAPHSAGTRREGPR